MQIYAKGVQLIETQCNSLQNQYFFNKRKVNYILPGELMHKSPVAAAMDFFIMGILKRRL